MNKRQLAAMAAAAMMLICMPTTAFAALGRPGQPSASVQQQVKSERKVIKKNVKETEEEAAADAGERQQGAQGRRPCRA